MMRYKPGHAAPLLRTSRALRIQSQSGPQCFSSPALRPCTLTHFNPVTLMFQVLGGITFSTSGLCTCKPLSLGRSPYSCPDQLFLPVLKFYLFREAFPYYSIQCRFPSVSLSQLLICLLPNNTWFNLQLWSVYSFVLSWRQIGSSGRARIRVFCSSISLAPSSLPGTQHVRNTCSLKRS